MALVATSVLVLLLAWTGLVWGRVQVICASSSCSISCPSTSRIFLLSAQYGHKLSSETCSSCLGSCCQYEPEEDCLRDVSLSSLGSLARDCVNTTTSCIPSLAPDPGNCSSSHRSDFSYRRFQYTCANDSQIQNFSTSGSRDAAEAGVLRYTDSGTPPDAASWYCRVEAADCSSLPATVLLYFHQSSRTSPNCSTLAVGDVSMPCNVTAQSRNVTLPVNVTVTQIVSDRNFTAWAVVRANDGSPLWISCGHNADNPSTPQECAGETTTPASSAAATGGGDYLAAAVVGWVFAVLTSVSTGVLLFLFLRREERCAQLSDLFQRRRRMPDPLPPPDTYDDPAPSQAKASADVGRSRDAGGAAATNDGFYMDMEGSQEAKPKGGKSRQSTAPAAAKAVNEEEYSPLEPEPESGETYSPLEQGEGGQGGDDDEYVEVQTEDIYENA